MIQSARNAKENIGFIAQTYYEKIILKVSFLKYFQPLTLSLYNLSGGYL